MFLKGSKNVLKDEYGDIIVFDNLTDHVSIKEIEWENEQQFSDKRFATLVKWKKIYSDGRFERFNFINNKIPVAGKVLELGCGSGWLSAKISALNAVNSLYCIDFSINILKHNFPQVFNWLKGDWAKTNRVITDFHELPFEDGSFDLVMGDAVLHHTKRVDIVLSEVKRVLKKGGVSIFTSEPATSKWREKQQKKNFAKWERSIGINENIYTMKEWKDFYKKAGFDLELIPYIFTENTPKIINAIKKFTPLRFFNGYLFSNYIFLTKRS